MIYHVDGDKAKQRSIKPSGVRRIFDLARQMKDPKEDGLDLTQSRSWEGESVFGNWEDQGTTSGFTRASPEALVF